MTASTLPAALSRAAGTTKALAELLRRHGLTVSLIGILAYLIGYPIVVILLRAFGLDERAPADVGLWSAFARLAELPYARELAISTLFTVLMATGIALIIGSGLAVLVERTDLPFKQVFGLIPLLPLLVSPIVLALGYVFLLDPGAGLLNVVFRELSGSTVTSGPIDVFTRTGVGFVLGLYAASFVYPYVRAGLATTDSALEDAGRICGAGTSRLLRTVTLPIVRPALISGGLLALIVSIAEFAIPSIIGSRTGLQVMATEIARQVRGHPASPETAAALAVIMMAITSTGFLLLIRSLGHAERYQTVGGKRATGVIRLGRLKWLIVVALLVFVTVTIVLPLVAIALVAIQPFWSGDAFAGPYTTEHLNYVLDRPRTWLSLRNSLTYSLLAASFGIGIAVLIAYIQRLKSRRSGQLLDVLGTIPLAVPGIVLGVGILFMSLRGPIVLYGTAAAIVIAYLANFLPMGLRGASTSVGQVRQELLDAARISGASAPRTLRDVLVPLSIPGLVAGWWLMVVVMLREFPMTYLLFNSRTTTLSVELFNLFEGQPFGRTAAFSGLVFLTGVAMTILAWVTLLPARRWVHL